MSRRRAEEQPAGEARSDEVTLTVLRFDPEQDCGPRFQHFRVRVRPFMNVLEALFEVLETQDGSLAFRYSCRGAVCGSCAVVINGTPQLACKTQLSAFPTGRILLEPLPSFEVIKDLVVDLDPFWEAYRAVEPWLQSVVEASDRERLMAEADRADLDELANCVLCASCWAACPVAGRQEGFLGPAPLAWLERFLADPRDSFDELRASRVDSSRGVWGCDTVFSCSDVCPKQVRPTEAIASIRRRLMHQRLVRMLKPGTRGG
jgi:succinate dehydrogenase / fumarate reductase iron-sulfur subunit